MRCTSPRTVGYMPDGVTISWSEKTSSREYPSFKLPCGKCLECRLEYAREWAVRCIHEAEMHPKNSFITLTYRDSELKSPKLVYSDFQLFMKKLRKLQNDPIGVFVTGEYGEITKRPHWHAILFGFEPSDKVYHRTTDLGDRIFKSKTLDKVWGKNDPETRPTEIGEVTFKSAGYCARYAAKKLVHGKDHEHDFHPISKKSSKNAIGKKWIQKYWPDVFNTGVVRLKDGSTCSIPRYYEKWLKDNFPEQWFRYVTEIKSRKIEEAQVKESKEIFQDSLAVWKRRQQNSFCNPLTTLQSKKILNKITFVERLQKYLKL